MPLKTRTGHSSTVVDLTGASDAVLKSRIRDIQQSEAGSDMSGTAKVHNQPVPVRKEVLCFALPALGSVLADPLMSVVDTAFVGQFSSLHLAALAPNTSIFNLFFQVFTFLGITTTSMIANRAVNAPGLTKAETESRRKSASTVLAHSMVLAVVCGVACCGIMLTCGPPMLSAVGASPETLEPALAYLRIRALAAPAVMVANVAQGALLGQSDSWTPLKVLLACGGVNLVLDYVMVLHWGWGITGAAVATTIAQVLAATFFVVYMKAKGKRGELVPFEWAGLPTVKTLVAFWDMANTLLSRTLFNMLAYTSLTTSAAGLGTLAAASHQVGLQVLWFLGEAPQALSVTAQSLIARDRGSPGKARQITHTLLQLGALFGVLTAGTFAFTMAPGSWMFSSDEAVRSLLPGIILPGAGALFLCSVAMVFDGVSIGMRKVSVLPKCNLAALVATLSVLALGSQMGFGLPGTWCALLAFNAARVIGHLVQHSTDWEHGLFGRGQLKPALAFSQ